MYMKTPMIVLRDELIEELRIIKKNNDTGCTARGYRDAYMNIIKKIDNEAAIMEQCMVVNAYNAGRANPLGSAMDYYSVFLE